MYRNLNTHKIKNMRKTLLFLLSGFILSLTIASCDYQPSADEIDQQKQESALKEAQAQAGMPGIHNYQEKKTLKMIYEMRDNEKLICYAYLFNELNGKLIFIGKCLGYGIPYSTQYSNPEKVEHEGTNYGLTLPQAEPNGLFMPASSEGTWLLLLDKQGTPHPCYVEPRIIVSPFELNT